MVLRCNPPRFIDLSSLSSRARPFPLLLPPWSDNHSSRKPSDVVRQIAGQQFHVMPHRSGSVCKRRDETEETKTIYIEGKTLLAKRSTFHIRVRVLWHGVTDLAILSPLTWPLCLRLLDERAAIHRRCHIRWLYCLWQCVVQKEKRANWLRSGF